MDNDALPTTFSEASGTSVARPSRVMISPFAILFPAAIDSMLGLQRSTRLLLPPNEHPQSHAHTGAQRRAQALSWAVRAIRMNLEPIDAEYLTAVVVRSILEDFLRFILRQMMMVACQ